MVRRFGAPLDREKPRRLFDLSGRVAIVTGGTRGIGRALAEGYVAAGARVVVASRKPDACKETEEHLRAMGGEALGVPTHLGEIGALRSLVERTLDAFGGIDIVVNNAANALALPHGEYTPEAWAKSLDVETTKLQLLPRMADPDEMVGPALMLTSDAGSFVTGHVVFVDGGMVPR